MKLDYHPASTAIRPVALFAAETGIPIDLQVVDIFKGEHRQAAYAAINPNALVPVLEDGDFRLTESSATPKDLADKFDSPLYSKDLRRRARLSERMDGFNTQVSRDFCFEVVGCDFAAYPYVQRWRARMTALKSWKDVDNAFDGFTAAHKREAFVSV